MKKLWWLLLILLVIPMAAANAAEAPDITRDCTFTYCRKNLGRKSDIRDRDYETHLTLKLGEYLEISVEETEISGVQVRFFERTRELTIQIRNGEEWIDAGVLGTYLTDWYAFPEGVSAFRLMNNTGKPLGLSDVNVYGPGDRPSSVQVWKEMDKAALMLIVAHPDDELLWFGGLLPTYAGERGLHVKVVYATAGSAFRRLELLDGLWTCGVREYPTFLMFPDAKTKKLSDAYRRWGAKKIMAALTDVIRQYRPDVVVTHAQNGESGHGAHRLLFDAVPKAVGYAADSASYPGEHPVWQVSKLYVHRWKENQQRFDWHTPLAFFGGEDSYSVTTRALACHVSQTEGGFWTMRQGEKEHTDNTLFGLYFTTVGPDVIGGDMMENLPQSVVSGATPTDI